MKKEKEELTGELVGRLKRRACEDLGYTVITFKDGSIGVTGASKKTLELLNHFAELVARAAHPRLCLDHGVECCIECEERCECCGDDTGPDGGGPMDKRHGQRLCINCVFDHDRGDFACGCEAPPPPKARRRAVRPAVTP